MKITEVPSFDGTAIDIPGHVIARWQKVYRNIQDWPAALQAVDEFCASFPSDDPTKLSRASLWLEQRNAEAGAA
jgi:hypothetical protein